MIKKILGFFIILYQKIISPALPGACRFYPTCSEYALNAIEEYGAVKGSVKAVLRLLRCQPFSAGGYDPVIKRTTVKNKIRHITS
ncbi:Membrane protein insertion efficiency factor YidD [hydrothermal vent metagenome]|uniref:Membrane protein insertion efficiency factor YidD n=1 Tax=hydrothermal vent metagenome TaxID=652676 RepID=A0A3B0QPN7_9ZZZZ